MLVSLLLRRKKSSIIAARMAKPPIVTPIPIPAFAPVDRPLFVMGAEVGEEVGGAVVGVEALDGDAVGELLEPDEVVVGGRSCCWYSIHSGCAHIVRGPVTVVILGAVLLARA